MGFLLSQGCQNSFCVFVGLKENTSREPSPEHILEMLVHEPNLVQDADDVIYDADDDMMMIDRLG